MQLLSGGSMESMLYNIFGQGAAMMVEGLQPSELASQPAILLQDLLEEAKLKKEACTYFLFCNNTIQHNTRQHNTTQHNSVQVLIYLFVIKGKRFSPKTRIRV